MDAQQQRQIAIGATGATGCGGRYEILAIREELGEACVVALVTFEWGARIILYKRDGTPVVQTPVQSLFGMPLAQPGEAPEGQPTPHDTGLGRDLAYLQRRAMGYADAIAACTGVPAADRANVISAIAMHATGHVVQLREQRPAPTPAAASIDGRDL